MKAVVLRSPAVVELAEVPEPSPKDADIVVQVEAAALNHADLAVLEGRLHGRHGGLGSILGLECAGYVASVGKHAHGWRIGDRVMTSAPGAFAERVAVDGGRAFRVTPDDLAFDQAACLPVALQTMHDALVTRGQLHEGDVVVIHGASSAVGLMGLQIARFMGARIVAGSSTRPDRRSRLTDWGADMAFDSSDEEWPGRLREASGGVGANLIVDMLSGPHMSKLLSAAALEARIINVGRLAGRSDAFDFDQHALKRVTYTGVTFRTRTVEEVREVVRRAFGDLSGALAARRLSLPVASTLPMAEASDALHSLKSNQPFGKIVLRPV